MSEDAAATGSDSKAEQVKEQVGQQAEAAREKARSGLRGQVDQRSTQAGERLAGTADEVRSVAEELRRQGKDTPARMVEQAAGQADRAADYLRQASGERILRDVEDLARSKPWAVAAGGLALGFAASRFLKASSSRRYRETGTGYRQQARAGDPEETQVIYAQETEAGYTAGVAVVGTDDPAGPDVRPPRAQ